VTYKIPPRLRKGNIVAVVATARAIDPDTVNAGIELLRGWGLQVITGKSLYQSHHLFAGTDRQRLEDLQLALDNQEVKAIFCARGGYGTTRLLDSINWEGFRRSPKWICGFSDVTSLLSHVHTLGYACLHSSMPQLLVGENAQSDSDSLRRALFDQEVNLTANPYPENQYGSAEGVITGGNLSLMVHLTGTNSDVDTDGKILLLEEVDEYLYHIDRMMVQLARTGKLRNIRGLIVGHLTRMKEGDLKFGTGAMGIIKSHMGRKSIPIGFGFPFGHASPNLAVPLGIKCNLQVTENGSILVSKY